MNVKSLRRYTVAFFVLSLAFATAAGAETFDLVWSLKLDPKAVGSRASLTVKQTDGELRRLRFTPDADHLSDFEADGELSRDGDEITWAVPRRGGKLEWKVEIEHARGRNAFDAYVGETWAMFRGDDVFPAAAAAMKKGSTSRATFEYEGPKGWSILTPFAERSSPFVVVNDERRFDRPTGWIVAGKIGVRRENIAGVSVAVGGPVNQGVRRMDILALLNWVLPEIVELIPDFPKLLTLVSAGDPMWRGGLSGPNSFYLHASRPLLSENGTSTLVHELIHIGLSRRASADEDWLIEGLAEYYSVELLRRTGTVTESRNELTMNMLREWAQEASTLRGRRAKGAVTAKAVLVLADVDREIRERSGGEHSLDSVMRELALKTSPLDLAEFRTVCESVVGQPLEALADARLAGYQPE